MFTLDWLKDLPLGTVGVELTKVGNQPTELRAVRSVRVCDHRDQENFSLSSIEYTLKVMPDSPACTHYKGRRTGGHAPLQLFAASEIAQFQTRSTCAARLPNLARLSNPARLPKPQLKSMLKSQKIAFGTFLF